MKKYDLAFGIGFSCAVSQALRDLGLQRESYPLDWVGVPGLQAGAQMIADDFRGWFEREDLRLWDVTFSAGHIARIYKNIRTGFGFPHEFTNAKPFEACYGAVKDKYDRRIARLYERIGKSGHVLAIYLESMRRTRIDDESILSAVRVLRGKFPSVRVDMAYLYEDPDATRAETMSDVDGVTIVRMDYRTFFDGRLMHVCDGRMIRSWLAENVSVGDALTPADMRRFADEKRNAYRKSLGGNPVSRWVNRKAKDWYADLEKYLIAQKLVPGPHPVWFDGEGH